MSRDLYDDDLDDDRYHGRGHSHDHMASAPRRSVLLLAALAACSDVEDVDEHGHSHEHGVVDVVELSFAPQSGGDAVVAEYHDGDSDPIDLVDGEVYDLSVSFFASDGDDLSADILDEGEVHQLFFLGDGIDSEATGSTGGVLSIDYGDADSGGLPIGLENTAEATTAGSAALRVVLRHLPEEDGTPVKTDGLAEAVAAGGLSSIGGDNDTDVTFDVTVSE